MQILWRNDQVLRRSWLQYFHPYPIALYPGWWIRGKETILSVIMIQVISLQLSTNQHEISCHFPHSKDNIYVSTPTSRGLAGPRLFKANWDSKSLLSRNLTGIYQYQMSLNIKSLAKTKSIMSEKIFNLDITLKLSWSNLETPFELLQNSLETSSISLEAPFSIYVSTHETFMKHPWNTLETSLKHPWSALFSWTPLKLCMLK